MLAVSSFHLVGVCFLQIQLRIVCQAFIFQETGSSVILLCGGFTVQLSFGNCIYIKGTEIILYFCRSLVVVSKT